MRTKKQTSVHLELIDPNRTFENGVSAIVMYYGLVQRITGEEGSVRKWWLSKVRSPVSQDLGKKKDTKSRKSRRHKINDFFKTF